MFCAGEGFFPLRNFWHKMRDPLPSAGSKNGHQSEKLSKGQRCKMPEEIVKGEHD